MGKLSVFNFITLNGYYKGKNEDISWHNKQSAEESEYAAQGAKSESILLFGRVTYQMMASFWPTPAAMESMPEVAQGMNKSEKIVFSRTLKKADWKGTRIISDNIVDEVRKLKKSASNDITILGSGSIVTQLAESNLIDNYQFMLDPVALGDGTSIFKGIKKPQELKLINTKAFKSGVILLVYEPVKK